MPHIRVYPMDPTTTRETCQRKQRFPTPVKAEAFRRREQLWTAQIYRCDWCAGFHLGRPHA